MSDPHLLAVVAGKDSEAFATLYDRFATLLYSVAMSILRDHSLAEDAVQEAFVLIWERAGSYDPALGKPLSWAVALTRNKALDRLRSLKRKEAGLDRLEQNSAVLASDAFEPDLNDRDRSSAVSRALNSLTPDQKHAIELAFIQGMSHAEIAQKLQQPLGTVKARIRRGMMELKDLLSGQPGLTGYES